MTQQHPITPPPELVQEWSLDCPLDDPFNRELYVATLAARWGADQELEACCKLLELSDSNAREFLCSARRPKPPSLKEQALGLLDKNKTRFAVAEEDIIRLALESLPD